MEEKRKINKLLLIAAVITPAVWVILWFGLIIFSNVQHRVLLEKIEKERGIEFREEFENMWKENDLDKTNDGVILPFVIGLAFIAIPTILTVIGERKNKRKLILAAGIVYIFTGVGIPSAVLCFIANAKMKKQNGA
jgi:hypothetical protein